MNEKAVSIRETASCFLHGDFDPALERCPHPDHGSGDLVDSPVGEFYLLREVEVELFTAVRRFDPFNSPHEGWAVIREELDELWDHVKANTGRDAGARTEAIQVAAMALRYVMDVSDA